MIKRQTNVVTFRLDPELRALLDKEAKHKEITISDLLQGLVEAHVRPADSDTFSRTAEIPARMLDVERWFGISIIESSKTLAPFGIKTVLDLARPDNLLAGLDHDALTDFAGCYEVEPEWLLTGQGPVYRPTHGHWSAYEVVSRIRTLWSQHLLQAVKFVSNRSEPSLKESTPVVVVLEKLHPHPELRHRQTVYESWLVVDWMGGNASLLKLVRFCLSLYRESGAFAVYPAGVTLTAPAYNELYAGTLHLAQALSLTEYAWNPESAYEDLRYAVALPKQVRYELKVAETWSDHDTLLAETLEDKRHAPPLWTVTTQSTDYE